MSKLEDAYRRCGDGHGLLAWAAQIELRLDRRDEALRHLRTELLARGPSSLAFRLARELVETLPPPELQTLRTLGSSPDQPLHLPSAFDRSSWVVPVVCQGEDPRTAFLSIPRPKKPELHRLYVECSIGRGQEVFFIDDSYRPQEAKAGDARGLRGQTPEVDHVLDEVRRRYGIDSPEELRRALTRPEPSLGLGWLLGFVRDLPEEVCVWGALSTKDPYDLEALDSQATALGALGETEAARAVLARVSPRDMRLRDLRGSASSGLQPSNIASRQCYFLYLQRKLAEAEKLCNEGVALGSTYTSKRYLARIALLNGDLVNADRLSVEVAKSGYGRDLAFRAIVLAAQNRPRTEIMQFASKAVSLPSPWMLGRFFLGRAWPNKTSEEWLALEESLDRDWSAEGLAECGHIYLELGVKERSERCFVASERLVTGPAQAGRALHLSETQPQQALTELEAFAQKAHHWSVMRAMAIIEYRLGRDREALEWLEQTLAREPLDWRANLVLTAICERFSGQVPGWQPATPSPAFGCETATRAVAATIVPRTGDPRWSSR